ncbi:hypothetical protein TRICI_003273 [Trichomonascus ciferrii]|uniref:Uncharacterized protein n=1 Tax=Trichomonascus ciferrii TaxID=44093 RepID=A0A642V485_9ASCO|nr:hypothetical protein TRICI_003273 [Trichomonascus ciferrii]
MEPLIDLSTPKVPAKTYSSDFTPTLSKALGECFKRRKQSLLPVAKENELQTIRESKGDLSAIQEGNTTAGSSANLTMGFSPADKLMNLDTPQSNLSRPGEWFDASFLNSNANNAVAEEKENNTMETSTPQKAGSSRKRPPSTPLTPSLFKDATINKKKRALNHKDSNVSCSSPSKLTTFWNDSDKHHTPDSVIQMRRLIHSAQPNEQPQEYGDNTNPGSCEDKRIHENPLDEVLYSKWLTEQHLHELQTVVEFMELEKHFAL